MVEFVAHDGTVGGSIPSKPTYLLLFFWGYSLVVKYMLCTHLRRVRFPLSPFALLYGKSLMVLRGMFAKLAVRVQIPVFPVLRENNLTVRV